MSLFQAIPLCLVDLILRNKFQKFLVFWHLISNLSLFSFFTYNDLFLWDFVGFIKIFCICLGFVFFNYPCNFSAAKYRSGFVLLLYIFCSY